MFSVPRWWWVGGDLAEGPSWVGVVDGVCFPEAISLLYHDLVVIMAPMYHLIRGCRW